MNESLLQLANRTHQEVGDYLYDTDPSCTSDLLWGFYDLYPNWIIRMLEGKTSLKEKLQDKATELEDWIAQVQNALKEQAQ
jgi:hypothetical protein